MQNITIISTEHREAGKCNSDELFKIIENIKPDVIFEEEIDDEKYFDYYKVKSSKHSLEIQCIQKYIQKYDIPHIPIDINVNFNYPEWDIMFDYFRKIESYNKLSKKHCELRNNI